MAQPISDETEKCRTAMRINGSRWGFSSLSLSHPLNLTSTRSIFYALSYFVKFRGCGFMRIGNESFSGRSGGRPLTVSDRRMIVHVYWDQEKSFQEIWTVYEAHKLSENRCPIQNFGFQRAKGHNWCRAARRVRFNNLKLLSTFTIMSVSTFCIKIIFRPSLFLHQRQMAGWQRSVDGE